MIARSAWVILSLVTWIGVAGAADSPRQWLERMVSASGQFGFRGTLVHTCGGKLDVVTVVHRVEDGRVTERVRSLDRGGREIIRKAEEVMCIMPDQGTVMVDGGETVAQHVDVLLEPMSSFANVNEVNYRLQMLGEEYVAGHPTEVIAIRSTDNFRYGYRLWLERERAMPLKYELIGEDGSAIEQTLFTEIEFTDRIASAEVQPSMVTDSFVWRRSGQAVSSADGSVPVTAGAWHATEVPGGFKLTSADARSTAEGGDMEHLVYSDGLASVSVFIESDVDDAERQEGMSEMGAMSAYTTNIDGFLVTAIGDVPMRTVRMIAMSVESRPAGD